MICRHVHTKSSETWLAGCATSNKLHLSDLTQLWHYNGMMASAISMMKRTNKWLKRNLLNSGVAIYLAFDASAGHGNNLICLIESRSPSVSKQSRLRSPICVRPPSLCDGSEFPILWVTVEYFPGWRTALTTTWRYMGCVKDGLNQ